MAALQPARLIDLSETTGIPRATVHRLLKQLIEVGAVRRDGTRYRLGASLLGLGALGVPERRLRVAARRPMAELAAATGAAVSLSAAIGGEVVFLDTVEARVPLGFLPEPGARVPAGTAQARAHAEIGRLAPVVDAGGVLPDLSCVAVAVPLGGGQMARCQRLSPGCAPRSLCWLPPAPPARESADGYARREDGRSPSSAKSTSGRSGSPAATLHF